jgi:hypothetical protein
MLVCGQMPVSLQTLTVFLRAFINSGNDSLRIGCPETLCLQRSGGARHSISMIGDGGDQT